MDVMEDMAQQFNSNYTDDETNDTNNESDNGKTPKTK